jgi:hypothetical protein
MLVATTLNPNTTTHYFLALIISFLVSNVVDIGVGNVLPCLVFPVRPQAEWSSNKSALCYKPFQFPIYKGG